MRKNKDIIERIKVADTTYDVGIRNIYIDTDNHLAIDVNTNGSSLPSTNPESKETKIRFESNRITGLYNRFGYDQSGQYLIEDKGGLCFAEFNNEHTSVFTRDYRFNAKGNVYAAHRAAPKSDEEGNIDYPTQQDGTKDILTDPNTDEVYCATWENIVKAGMCGLRCEIGDDEGEVTKNIIIDPDVDLGFVEIRAAQNIFLNAGKNISTNEDTTISIDTREDSKCSISDIITFTNWAKENNFGPWAE